MSVPANTPEVEVTLRGNVGGYAGDNARDKVARALAVAHRPVRRTHVVLEWRQDPALARPAVAEVSADVDGTVLRAKAAAASMQEAVDEVERRLRRRLVQLQERDREAHRWTGRAGEHEWRHGDLPRQPLPYFPRAEEDREVVRRKTFAGAAMTVDEAAYEMDLLDHDFFLFRDVGSGDPALVHRLPEGSYAVQGADPDRTGATAVAEPAPPVLTDAEARTRLDADGEPFVFYVDAGSGEGRVLYHRYDGHYGLVALVG